MIFYVAWIQWGSCFMYIAISTRYKSIQIKNIAFYSKRRDFFILAKVSKKTENIFLRKFGKILFYLQNRCFRWMPLPVFMSILPFGWPYWVKEKDFSQKIGKRVCDKVCQITCLQCLNHVLLLCFMWDVSSGDNAWCT